MSSREESQEDDSVFQAQPSKSRRKQQSVESERKSRYTQQGRDYKCPCGKAYLSNPALYTHIKIKHDGKRPGPLALPPSEDSQGRKRRGRRIRRCTTRANFNLQIREISEDSDFHFDAVEAVSKLLVDVKVKTECNFVPSSGKRTCQDMASRFLEQISKADPEHIKVMKFYFDLLKDYLNTYKDPSYWKSQSPQDILFEANEFSRKYERKEEKFKELKRQTIVDITHLICRWMYKRNWTSNKLVKRAGPTVFMAE